MVTAIADASGLANEAVDAALTRPPSAEQGDFAFPCFVLAKTLKKAPPVIAQELAAKVVDASDLIAEARPVGPYLNFFTDRQKFTDAVLRTVLAAGDAYGGADGSKSATLGTIAIDYSSPNIAKPFHVGHMRSTIIGGALYRIFAALGHKVVGINHLGDWGTQFGKLAVAIERWGQPEDLKDLMALNRLYARYHDDEEQKAHPELDDEARAWFKRQEAGDAEALALWQKIRDVSLDYFKKIYARLGVQFDSYAGESFFNDKMEAVIEAAKAKGLVTVSEGAEVIDLTEQGIEVPALLRKSDGATLYLTRDLAAILYRRVTYDFEELIYVVGAEQSLHFQQLFAVLERFGDEAAGKCVHVKFGRVEGMASRKGNVVYLEALLDEAKERALKNMRENVEKRPEEIDEDQVAEAVGLAAIFFSDLSKQRVKDYVFDWDRAISFEGDTGPYLLNAHARIAGIIRRCGIELDPDADVAPLTEPEAIHLVTVLQRYPDALRLAARSYEPSVVSQYLLDLAHALHASYQTLRVKGEETSLAQARLLLFSAVKQVLKNGLAILGIPALEKM